MKLRSLLMVLSIFSMILPAYADPPPWAPAHGWRKKHDPYYTGYTGRQWDNDYGIISAGQCNRQAIATVLGGVTNGTFS